MTIRRKLKCIHCPSEISALSPADYFTEATLEACDIEHADIASPEECPNCHNITIYYWHNKELEKTLLQKERDLFFYKNSFLSDSYIVSEVIHKIWEEVAKLFLEAMTPSDQRRAENVIRDEILSNALLRDYLLEFAQMRKDRMFSKGEQESYIEEILESSKSLNEEFRLFLKGKDMSSGLKKMLEEIGESEKESTIPVEQKKLAQGE